uniref:Solute carrier family 25 member 51 n=2 Tax=Timema tahoe TaxID=61484 RepID=A0A7R9IGB7_9NEOP|nr:unnamed protein product [Timema tahoe]
MSTFPADKVVVKDRNSDLSLPLSKKLLLSNPEDDVSRGGLYINLREFVCGWGAAFINIAVTFPVSKLIFRQMIHNVGVSNAFGQLSNEGFYFLYRGILPPLCQKTITLSLMFGIYEECRRPLMAMQVPPLLAKSSAAIIAGSVEVIIMPLERVQTLLQDQRYNRSFKNTHHAFRVIASNYGIAEFYRGLVPILIRNGGANVCFFVARDELMALSPANSSWWGKTTHQFVSGAVIGAVTSTIFYPLNVVKVHIQSKLGGEYQSLLSAFVEIVRERGGASLYRGVHLNYTRAFFSWGIINASYEFLKKLW